MTIPKELAIPRYPFPDSMLHSSEYIAHELFEAMRGLEVVREGPSVLPLPMDSIAADVMMETSETITLPVSTRVLSGFVQGPYKRVNALDWLYFDFGMRVEYAQKDSLVTAHVGHEPIFFSAEQTFTNYSENAYQRMIFGFLACLSEQDRDLLDGMRRYGVLITTGLRSTETSLLVLGDNLGALGLPRLPWQPPWQSRLYPVDLWRKSYAEWARQGMFDIEERVKSMLPNLRPVGVKVESDTIGDVFPKHPSLL